MLCLVIRLASLYQPPHPRKLTTRARGAGAAVQQVLQLKPTKSRRPGVLCASLRARGIKLCGAMNQLRGIAEATAAEIPEHHFYIPEV